MEKNKKILTKKAKETVADTTFQPWESNKNFLIVDDENSKYFKDLKLRVKEETGLNFTYNKLVTLLLEAVDPKKINYKIKVLKDVLKGGK
jgi:hypothetical protein